MFIAHPTLKRVRGHTGDTCMSERRGNEALWAGGHLLNVLRVQQPGGLRGLGNWRDTGVAWVFTIT